MGLPPLPFRVLLLGRTVNSWKAGTSPTLGLQCLTRERTPLSVYPEDKGVQPGGGVEMSELASKLDVGESANRKRCEAGSAWKRLINTSSPCQPS